MAEGSSSGEGFDGGAASSVSEGFDVGGVSPVVVERPRKQPRLSLQGGGNLRHATLYWFAVHLWKLNLH